MASLPGQPAPIPYREPPARPQMPANADWSLEEDLILETALAESWGPQPVMLQKAAEKLPMRTLEQVQARFKLLEEDVANIDAGRVPLPNYASAQEQTAMERRKGIAWTEEEHRLFLMGLAKFGKGDWRSISRNFVISRTPTQVASHAQKYFIRLNSMNKKDKRRSSIHDITTPGGNGADVTGVRPPAPVTGQPGQPMSGALPVVGMIASRPGGPMTQPGAVIGQPRPLLMQPRPPQ